MLTDIDMRRMPKVLLHDHLDGGLRPATIIELAQDIDHALPSKDPAMLAQWFADQADAGNLEQYLTTFDQTVAVMQSYEAIERVAAEAVQDVAADGVVYAEFRFAPEQHLRLGMTPREVAQAALEGIRRGEESCASEPASECAAPIQVGLILSAMRQAQSSVEIAQLAIEMHGNGVCGFDIAGPEAGFPPELHVNAFAMLREAGVPITIHAGEAAGLDSIQAALDQGATRIGHGVRLAQYLETPEGKELSARIVEQDIALELCPSSNVQTGAAASIADHPITQLAQAGLPVTINTDNRLMSQTSLSHEMMLVHREAQWDWDDLCHAVQCAARNAFISDQKRAELEQVISSRWLQY
jgi:adenosine deaminase